uniref:GIY-YIG endonuclease n=1 Tax=Sphaerobolus stellatus TaxID=68786 RepID=A0A7D4V7G7_9AGAM|nr:GIY-YIG endonuclease [Sphaerobolus stellatus]
MPYNRHIERAHDTLKLMIESLSEETLIYKFILEKIKTAYKFNAKVVKDKLIPNNADKWKSFSPFSLPYHKGGTYLFHQTLTNDTYIGSAANHTDRAIQNSEQFRGVNPRSLHIQEKDKQETLLFSIIHEVPSLVKLFRKEYPKYLLSKGEYEILLAITTYTSRILEQYLIDQFKPTINGKGGIYDLTVTHKFTNWDKTNLNKKLIDNRGSIPVNIFNLDGSLEYSANSLNDASKYLQMSATSVYLYVNNSKSYFSKHLNKHVRLVELEFTGDTKLRKIEHSLKNVNPLILDGKDLNNLDLLFLYCFSQDKKTYQTFLTDAYRNLFPKNSEILIKNNKTFTGSYNYIRNRINLDVSVLAEDGKSYYLAKNPERLDTEIRDNSVLWLIDLEKFEAKLYPNLHKVVDYFKSISKSEITLRLCNYYKNTGKRYKNYLFLSHDYFIKVIPDASKPGIAFINFKAKLTDTQEEVEVLEKIKIIISSRAPGASARGEKFNLFLCEVFHSAFKLNQAQTFFRLPC